MGRLNLTVEIQSVGPKRVNVRSSLVVANFIASVQDKFNLDGRFELYHKGERRLLDETAALEDSSIAEGDVLVCARLREDTGTQDAIRNGARQRFSKKFRRAYLTEQSNRIEYDLVWSPAVIGRKDMTNPSMNRLLAVDLEDLEETPSVSRHHAAITESGGSFFIESINDRNLTILNGQKIRPGAKYPLPAGATFQVGNLTLVFNLIV